MVYLIKYIEMCDMYMYIWSTCNIRCGECNLLWYASYIILIFWLKYVWCPENCELQFSGHHSYFRHNFNIMLAVSNICQMQSLHRRTEHIWGSGRVLRDLWQLSLGCLLMRTTASSLRYTGYLNSINGHISRVSLLILVHVQQPSCLFV